MGYFWLKVLNAEMQLWIIKPIKMYNQLVLSISVCTCSVFFCLFWHVRVCCFFSVNHRIVCLYVWFVSMCLCCLRPNKIYVVVVKKRSERFLKIEYLNTLVLKRNNPLFTLPYEIVIVRIHVVVVYKAKYITTEHLGRRMRHLITRVVLNTF